MLVDGGVYTHTYFLIIEWELFPLIRLVLYILKCGLSDTGECTNRLLFLHSSVCHPRINIGICILFFEMYMQGRQTEE